MLLAMFASSAATMSLYWSGVIPSVDAVGAVGGGLARSAVVCLSLVVSSSTAQMIGMLSLKY